MKTYKLSDSEAQIVYAALMSQARHKKEDMKFYEDKGLYKLRDKCEKWYNTIMRVAKRLEND